jgi:hypothetical protein
MSVVPKTVGPKAIRTKAIETKGVGPTDVTTKAIDPNVVDAKVVQAAGSGLTGERFLGGEAWAWPPAPFRSALVSGFLWALSTSACSLTIDADRVQCSVDADCAARGSAFAGAMCLDQVCQPNAQWACLSRTPTPSTTKGPFKVDVLAITDAVSQQKIAGATLKLCRKIDVGCQSPVLSTTTDASGAASFSIDATLTGYVEVSAAGFLPTLYFFNPPIDGNRTVPTIPISTELAHSAVLRTLGLTPDEGRGTVVMATVDCNGKTAADVAFSVSNMDSSSKVFYYVDGLPTAAAATTSSGYGGVANVPAGAVTFNATVVKGGLALPPVSLVVRGGALSFSTAVPFVTGVPLAN